MNKYLKQAGLFLILVATVALHNPTETIQGPKSSANIPNMSITISFFKPNEGALVNDELDIAVDIDSLYEIQSVTAQVEDHMTNLVAGQYCLNPLVCWPAWLGTLSLAGLERGDKVLTVVATDIFGGSAQNQRSFFYDQPPVVNISTPLEPTVARPQLHISATCVDDDPAGCVSLTVRAVPYCGGTTPPLASGQASIDETISLVNYGAADLTLCFEGYDSAGQWRREFRQVYVESSTRLEEVEQVDGYIKDISSDRILYLADPGGLIIRDRATSQDTTVMANPGTVTNYGFLAPNGAIFVEQSGSVLTAKVHDWQNGTLINLGQPNSNDSLEAAGDYAIWNVGTALHYRNLVTGTDTIISSNSGNWFNDVADNGDVVYWDSYQVFRYRAGVTTQLTNDVNLWNTYTSTDGINVVYRKHTPCCTNQTYSITMYGASGEITLAPSRTQEPQPPRDYQLNNGWVAFTKPGGGALQVWKRSPGGVETQLSFFGSSSYIDSLGPNGEVTFVNGSRLYLSDSNFNGLVIGSGLGKSYWINGELFRVIGGNIFKVNPNVPDLVLATTSSPDLVYRNEVLNYTITVTNDGPIEATGVVMTDTLPSGVSFAAINENMVVSQNTNCNNVDQVVTCNLGNLANGANMSVSLLLTITSEEASANKVHVWSNEKDYNLANSTVTQMFPVGSTRYLPLIFK